MKLDDETLKTKALEKKIKRATDKIMPILKEEGLALAGFLEASPTGIIPKVIFVEAKKDE